MSDIETESVPVEFYGDSERYLVEWVKRAGEGEGNCGKFPTEKHCPSWGGGQIQGPLVQSTHRATSSFPLLPRLCARHLPYRLPLVKLTSFPHQVILIILG
jgi:hypothetical protein